MLQSVLAWAEQVRALHIGAYSPLHAAPHVALVQASRHARLEQAIMACQPRLLSILGAPVAYRVLAQAVSMIEAEWLMQLMDSGAHAHASEQSWVVAVLGMSIAWQSSDRASPLAPTTGPCPGPVPCEPPFHGPCPGSEETPPTGRPMTRGSADGKAAESWLRQLPGVQERHIMPMQVAMATQGGRLHADFLPDFLFPMDLLEASGNAHAEDPQKKRKPIAMPTCIQLWQALGSTVALPHYIMLSPQTDICCFLPKRLHRLPLTLIAPTKPSPGQADRSLPLDMDKSMYPACCCHAFPACLVVRDAHVMQTLWPVRLWLIALAMWQPCL